MYLFIMDGLTIRRNDRFFAVVIQPLDMIDALT